MTVKIDEKIVSAEVVKNAPAPTPVLPYERPLILRGTTYKIRPPTLGAALYVTINDLELPDKTRRPLEVFLNTKDVTHTQWMHALTRMLSFILRQPNIPIHLAVDELKQISDPEGHYFLPKADPAGRGKVGGMVAHIGRVIEEHCIGLGIIKKPEMSEAQKTAVAEKKVQAEKAGIKAQECPKCHELAMYLMDGCLTCTSCGESKCG